jgi:hypothetical protein
MSNTLHPDAEVALRLRVWDIRPGTAAYRAAAVLFPTYAQMYRFVKLAYLKSTTQAGREFYAEFLVAAGTGRIGEGHDTRIWVEEDLRLAHEYGVQADELDTFAWYINGLNHSGARRGSVFPTSREEQISRDAWNIFLLFGWPRVEKIMDRGIRVFHETNLGGIQRLLRSGASPDFISEVPISFSTLGGTPHQYSLHEALAIHEVGVPIDYAVTLSQIFAVGSLGDLATGFWRAGVDAEYAVACERAGHSMEDAVRMWRDGIALEYVTVMGES